MRGREAQVTAEVIAAFHASSADRKGPTEAEAWLAACLDGTA